MKKPSGYKKKLNRRVENESVYMYVYTLICESVLNIINGLAFGLNFQFTYQDWTNINTS